METAQDKHRIDQKKLPVSKGGEKTTGRPSNRLDMIGIGGSTRRGESKASSSPLKQGQDKYWGTKRTNKIGKEET